MRRIAKRNLSTSEKVRKLVGLFGGKKVVVEVMGGASSSSLRRWMSRKCRPILAHVLLVADTYQRAQRIRVGVRGILKNWKPETRKEFYAFFGNDLKRRLK